MDILMQTDAFFAGREKEWRIFEQMKSALTARWPDTQLRVMKTCISFDDPKPYCYVSFPRKKSMNGIMVTISRRGQTEHPRFFMIAPISNKRCTVHIHVADVQEIDEELLELIADSRD
ncbi:MAG: hypothetical protein IJD60_03425 [Clostridia bacterium]|nr:hypothetical protein [Clostridia bacterium]